MAYAVIFAVAGTFLLNGLWGLYFEPGWRWVLLVPEVAGLVDIGEDVLLLRSIADDSAPDDALIRDAGLVDIARIFTRAKFGLYFAEFALVAVGSIFLISAGVPTR
jgi:hypothetical protein